MTDSDKHISNIQNQSRLSDLEYVNSSGEEINLRELLGVLWSGKWWIIGITFLSLLAGVLVAINMPNIYTSYGVYAPAQKTQGVNGLAAQYGGLAAMAGINLGSSESNDLDQAMALMSSWQFLEKVIEKHNLKPVIIGVKGWDKLADKFIWADDLYNPENQRWVRKPAAGMPVEPTAHEVYKELRKKFVVSKDNKTGLVTISVDHYSPKVAADIAAIIVREVNLHFQLRDVREAQERIKYLEKKISETSIAEMQSVFYGMIEAQTKTLMLAEVSEEYLLRTVVANQPPEEKSKPKRSLVVVFMGLLGGVAAVIFLIVRYFGDA